MLTIPLSVAKYIRSVKLAETMLAYLSVNEEESLTNWGGEIHYYGLSNLNIGQSVTEKLSFLEGMLPLSEILVLPFLSLDGEHCAHVHLVPYQTGIYILLFDATCEHEQLQEAQQQLNDLKLVLYRKEQLIDTLKAENYQLRNESKITSSLKTLDNSITY
jgi:hypothetical protein